MIYEYNEQIVNRDNDFASKNKFVGYILPNGNVYACQNHNISNVDTFLRMYLVLIDDNFEKKDELLSINTEDKLAQTIINKLKSMSHDEIHSFLLFIEKEKLLISDILVRFFNCHLITRLKKEIITSELNHMCFYNYLLNDFRITTLERIIYNDETKQFHYARVLDRNDYLYDEIEKIKKEINDDNINLFYKTK